MMKARPDQKIEDALDEALKETFPASDPVAALQPTSAGMGDNPGSEPLKPDDPQSSRKDAVPRAAA